MLVLRRKENESIILNGVIKVTVLMIESDRVKLGISAPPDVIILREELLADDRRTLPAPRTPIGDPPREPAG